jgi:hypothetical protein
MVGAGRAVASRVGAAVVDGREMRGAADHRRQPVTTIKHRKLESRDDCSKKKNLVKTIIRITRGIDAFARIKTNCTVNVPYIPKYNIDALYFAKNLFNTYVIYTRDQTIINVKD